MDITVLLTLAGCGLAVGFLSGLVGIGGGVLIVPLLYFFYAQTAWSGVLVAADLQPVISHATSLFVILPTTALGTWTYNRVGAVEWSAALPIAGASVVGALLGSQIAASLPAPLLKLGFGALLFVSGVRLVRPRKGEPRPSSETRAGVTIAAGLAVGLFASVLGVGGGIIAIPILVHVVGLRLEKVAATSMAIIVFTAAAGMLGYAVSGMGEAGRPPGSIGYIHLGAGLPILLGSLAAVPLGTAANRRMGTRGLRLLFGLLFVLLGLRLLVENATALPWLG